MCISSVCYCFTYLLHFLVFSSENERWGHRLKIEKFHQYCRYRWYFKLKISIAYRFIICQFILNWYIIDILCTGWNFELILGTVRICKDFYVKYYVSLMITDRPIVVDGRGDRSAELSEIDERLSRLCQFMQENLKWSHFAAYSLMHSFCIVAA